MFRILGRIAPLRWDSSLSCFKSQPIDGFDTRLRPDRNTELVAGLVAGLVGAAARCRTSCAAAHQFARSRTPRFRTSYLTAHQLRDGAPVARSRTPRFRTSCSTAHQIVGDAPFRRSRTGCNGCDDEEVVRRRPTGAGRIVRPGGEWWCGPTRRGPRGVARVRRHTDCSRAQRPRGSTVAPRGSVGRLRSVPRRSRGTNRGGGPKGMRATATEGSGAAERAGAWWSIGTYR